MCTSCFVFAESSSSAPDSVMTDSSEPSAAGAIEAYLHPAASCDQPLLVRAGWAGAAARARLGRAWVPALAGSAPRLRAASRAAQLVHGARAEVEGVPIAAAAAQQHLLARAKSTA